MYSPAVTCADAPPPQRSTRHLDFLDVLRGLAILWVMSYHALSPIFGRDHLPWAGWVRDFTAVPASFLALLPMHFGWAGVAIFFVVSGFCIHLSHRRNQHEGWPGYVFKRFFRIYPPYLLALLFFAFAFGPTRIDFHSRDDWFQVLTHASLLHNFWPRTFYGINPVFWSIAVEVQLYLIYPLLLWLTARLGWKRTLTLLAILEIAIRIYAGVRQIHLLPEAAPAGPQVSPFGYWFSWSLGAALAESFLLNQAPPFRRLSVWLCTLLAAGCFLVRPLFPFAFFFFALAAAAYIARALQREGAPASPWKTALTATGAWSYSLYLFHPIAPAYYSKILSTFHLPPLPKLLAYALCLTLYVAPFLLSWLFYRYCEIPSIALGKLAARRFLPRLNPLQQPLA